MRWTVLLSVPLLCASGLASAQDQRHLAKTTATYRVWGALSPADYAWADCDVVGFTPTTRAVSHAGSEPAHNPTPFEIPFCPWERGPASDYSWIVGRMSTNSLRDLGTYTLHCHDQFVARQVPPCSLLDGICGRTTVCLNADTTYHPDRTLTIEVYNDPPTLSVAHSGSVISGRDVAHDANITLNASASDPDGGSVSVSWVVTPPRSGATAVVGSLSGSSLNIQFNGESNFDTWTFEARADDNEGERVISTYTLNVINQPPAPTISGPARVRVGDPIMLSVSADEDGGSYTSVAWEVLPPGGVWGPVGSAATLSQPTGAGDLGFWRFRVRVTDNETPPLSGSSAEYEVEVYNDPPMLTATPPPSPVPADGGLISLSAMATDPDGGSVTVAWRAVQAPASAGVVVGTPLVGGGSITIPNTAAHAGTWVFRATATDDEGDSVQSAPFTVLVDALPQVAIENEPAVVVGPGIFYLTDESVDPDSRCDDPADPNRCHLVEPGATLVHPSPGISSWLWSVESIPTEYRDIYSPERVSVVFGVPDSLQSIPFLEGTIRPGTYRFRLDITDGEGNPSSGTITVEVLPPPIPPIAHVGLPQQYEADGARALTADVVLNGSLSFDPDNARSFTPPPGAGITSWSWTPLPPPGCAMSPTMAPTPISVMLSAGAVIPTECFGLWTVRLTVTDDDAPPEVGFADALVVLRSCASDICIDTPTAAAPELVDPSAPVDVPILYYVDTGVYLRPEYAFGFYAFIDILPTGSFTPIKTLVDTTVSTRPGQLTTVRWRGDTDSGGSAPTGTYDVRVRLMDITLTPGPQARENMAILHENIVVDIDSGSDRYVRHPDLESGADTVDIVYDVTGAFGVDQVRLAITTPSGALAHEVVLATTAVSGAISWDGRNSGTMLPPGHYEAQVSAYSGGRRLGQSDKRTLTVYKLGLGPASGAIVTVGLNRNDDDGDGTIDRDDTDVPGENDLGALEVRIEPLMGGEIGLTAVSGGAPVLAYSTRTKFGPLGMPATYTHPHGFVAPTLWVEGRSVGLYELEMIFTPDGGPALSPERVRVAVRGVEIISDSNGTMGYQDTDPLAESVVPGIWAQAHQTSGGSPTGFIVRNTLGNEFIERDPAHFYVRVTDPSQNMDPVVQETVFVEVSTLERFPVPAGDPEVIIDMPDVVTALETGPDTGVFVTMSQLITSNDEDLVEGDDEHFTLDRSGTNHFDDLAEDRTHRIGSRAHGFLKGGVRVSYLGEDQTVSVCGRSPDVRRYVHFKVAVLREPFQDTGIVEPDGSIRPGTLGDGIFNFDNTNTTTDVGGTPVHDPEELSEPYLDISTGAAMYLPGGMMSAAMGLDGRGAVDHQARIDDQLHRANGAWAPACLEFRQSSSIYELDAPNNAAGVSVLADGVLDLDAPNEVAPIVAVMNTRLGLGPLTDSTLYFAYGPITHVRTGGTGIAFGATMTPMSFPSLAGRVVISMNAAIANNIRAMAHELGHALSNTGDVPTDPWIFYPSTAGIVDDTYQFRRFPEATGVLMLKPRTAGDYSDTGNTHLQSF